MGGRGTLMGTIVGAFILTLIGDVVFLLKLQSYWQWVMSGVILMLVVVLTALTEIRPSPRSGSMKRWLTLAEPDLSRLCGALLLFALVSLYSPGFAIPAHIGYADHARRLHRHRRHRPDHGDCRRRHRSERAVDPQQRRHPGRPRLAHGQDLPLALDRCR